MPDHLYTEEDGLFIPTAETGSPWSETAQHGGPVNALFMRAAERAAAVAGLRVTRLSVDILKPVPLTPLRLQAEFIRQGRRLAIFDGSLARTDDGAPVAVMRAVLLKAHPDQAANFPPPAHHPPGPVDMPRRQLVSDERRAGGPPGFHLCIDIRHGGPGDSPITWLTWPHDLIGGETVTPAQRCAAMCDLTTVVSGRIHKSPPGAWDNTQFFNMLNTDTTVHLFRPAVGEWFGFADSFIADHQGTGVAEVTLYDAEGCLGRSVQTAASNA